MYQQFMMAYAGVNCSLTLSFIVHWFLDSDLTHALQQICGQQVAAETTTGCWDDMQHHLGFQVALCSSE